MLHVIHVYILYEKTTILQKQILKKRDRLKYDTKNI